MTLAALAIEAIVDALAAGGVTASRDASGFDPSPIGVLVGLPSLVDHTLGGATFDVPVVIVSGDPVNTSDAVDRLYTEADAIAEIVHADTYRPTSWAGSSRTQPLPAIEVSAIVTVAYESEA